MKVTATITVFTFLILTHFGTGSTLTYPIVDTGQKLCFDNSNPISSPAEGSSFYGQDAQYLSNPPNYRDNNDGTISDLNTGLMWTQSPGDKQTLANAIKGAKSCKTGGHDDWRLPSIKELYSLILFTGTDPDPQGKDTSGLIPFIDTNYFDFTYGNPAEGKRIIDAQYATSTQYVSTTMHGNETMFGVNFADGRIKGYATETRRGTNKFHVLYVRENPDYGSNRFEDNGDGTVTDHSTGLTWLQKDSKAGMDWNEALEYSETLEFAGHDDWRLPNAKELQSIVDYTRSPDTTQSAAIDPIFQCTAIINEGDNEDFASYWTSTSHKNEKGAKTAVYICFGRSLGFMKSRSSPSAEPKLLDVHGAGAQRSDPKTGDASRYPYGRGPQGDVIRIENLVRCVRGGQIEKVESAIPPEQTSKRSNGHPDKKGFNDPGRPSERKNPFLQRFDQNADGQVTRSEFTGPSRRFEKLDRDQNGVIAKDELPSGPPERTRPQEQKKKELGKSISLPTTAVVVDSVKTTSQTTSEKSPNIILILADDMGWTGTSVQLDPNRNLSQSDFYQTPNLEKLAKNGIRFSNAYSPSCLCTPSRAAILTGKTPARLHMTTPGNGRGKRNSDQKLQTPVTVSEFSSAETTIAEALKLKGYQTAHFGKWHLGKESPGEHGFDQHDGPTGNNPSSKESTSDPKEIFGITKRAVDFIERQTQTNTPFYLQLSHYAVHDPIEARPASITKFRNIPEGKTHSDASYAAMTWDLDESIDQVISKLKSLGIEDNTYVVFFSDNGAPGNRRRPNNTPLRSGKGTLYEGGIRVPLIITGPNISPDTVSNINVNGIDLFPTFCKWAGISVTDAIEGTDLSGLLTQVQSEPKRPNETLFFHYPHYGRGPQQKPQSAVIKGDYKLVKNYETHTVEVFHLNPDISESKDISKTMPEKQKELEKELQFLLQQSNAQLPQ